jgi:hypothetical protein
MTEQIKFWVVREGEDPYKVAPEVAGAIADELLEPFDNKECAFCTNKAPSSAVIAHRVGADIYTASICADCARMTDEQLAEKAQQDAKAAEQRRAEIRTAYQSLIDDGSIVPTGEMRRNPATGELRPVYVAKKFADKKFKHR